MTLLIFNECQMGTYFHLLLSLCAFLRLEMLTELQTTLSCNQGYELCGEGLWFDDDAEHDPTPVHNQEQSRFCLSTGTRRPSQAQAWHCEGVTLAPMAVIETPIHAPDKPLSVTR